MPIRITAFACKFRCGRIATKKKPLTEHEARCWLNPEVRGCKTCLHLGTDSETIYNPHHGGNPGSTDWEVEYRVCLADESIDLRNDGLRTKCPLWKTANPS